MSVGTAILGGATALSAVLGANAAKSAANAQAGAASQGSEVQERIFQQQREDTEPWRLVGQNALARLADSLGILSPDMKFQETPGYQFAFDEGMRAVENSAAARGTRLSGNQLRALTQYGQGMANQEYGNWLNRLAAASGTGQTAVGQTNAAGANYASNMANLIGQQGAARASGYVGQANAVTGGVNNLMLLGALGKI